MMRAAITIILLSAALTQISAADSLKQNIREFISQYDATVGVAVITDGDTTEINCGRTYPLASVMKFPQALAACDAMQEKGTPLDSIISLTKSDLHGNTVQKCLSTVCFFIALQKATTTPATRFSAHSYHRLQQKNICESRALRVSPYQ